MNMTTKGQRQMLNVARNFKGDQVDEYLVKNSNLEFMAKDQAEFMKTKEIERPQIISDAVNDHIKLVSDNIFTK